MAVSSYGKGTRSSGAVKLIKDLDEPIEGKNVLVVEDILDTGLTLAYLRKLFLQQRPKSLRIATLLDKPSRRIEKIEADYVGFSIPNLFVIGYGMDYAERYRNLPDICLIRKMAREKSRDSIEGIVGGGDRRRSGGSLEGHATQSVWCGTFSPCS